MTSGKVARLHRRFIQQAAKQEDTAAELRAKVRDADNEVYRLRDDMGMLRDRLEQLERAQEPVRVGFRGRRLA